MQKTNFTCCFVQTWNLFPHTKGRNRMTVFQNRLLKRIFHPNREEVVWGWKRLYNEELCNLHTSPNTVRLIKSRKMRLAEKEMRNAYKILDRILNKRDHLEI